MTFIIHTDILFVTAIRIVPASKVNFKRDAEYCILIYSQKTDNYLMNAGYIGEQLDLYLVSQNIGTLWFGIGKPDEHTFDGLDYVIMIAVHKVSDGALFRKDMFKAKRKEASEIWQGDTLGIAKSPVLPRAPATHSRGLSQTTVPLCSSAAIKSPASEALCRQKR